MSYGDFYFLLERSKRQYYTACKHKRIHIISLSWKEPLRPVKSKTTINHKKISNIHLYIILNILINKCIYQPQKFNKLANIIIVIS